MKRKGIFKIKLSLALGIMSLMISANETYANNPSPKKPPKNPAGRYSIQQAMSDKAQLSTIAFSGLAFITGSSGADTFIPPGKVADFFGFQYMRDVDVAGYGHNTTFLNKAAGNILKILTPEQRGKLMVLAKEQAPIFVDFAYNRYPLMNAFRRDLEGKAPAGSHGINIDRVSAYTKKLYQMDAELSYKRAAVMGEIIRSFTKEQKDYLEKMKFNDSSTWPAVTIDKELKRGMGQREFVAVMTYASELFSWYKGNLEADTYFCPERHGTYFGGFFMKDFPAMNNPNYFISTEITGDKGKMFLDILDDKQRAKMMEILTLQKDDMTEIAQIRREVSEELRKGMTSGKIDRNKVFALIGRYGELDGKTSAIYSKAFTYINKTLTTEQRSKLIQLRDLAVIPEGSYLYSTPIKSPTVPNNDFLFGIGSMPEDAGLLKAPKEFSISTRGKK